MLEREHFVSVYMRAAWRTMRTRALGLAVLIGTVASWSAPLAAQQQAGPKMPPGVPPELQDFLRQALSANNAAAAENDKVGGKWRGVPRIKGHASIVYRTTIDEGSLPRSEVSSRQEEATVRFELERDDSHGTENLIWRAKRVDLAGGTNYQSTFVWAEFNTQSTEVSQFRGPPERVQEVTLGLETDAGRWELGTPGHTRDRYTVHRHTSGQRYEGRWVGVNETETQPDNRVQSYHFSGTIPDQPGVVTAVFSDDGIVAEKPTRRFEKRARIMFWPEFDDYALEVTIEDYAKWRPLGIVGAADKAGSQLTAKAVVVPKGSSPPAQVKAIRFELLDVSREPGVCMNWPLGATDRNPDLKLARAPELPGASLSAEDQKLEVTRPLFDPQLRPYALGRIESFDFGARATLRVTCELLDGRELVGELKDAGDEAGQDLIRLPKMAGPDWIAESWKKENDAAALPDMDDSEKVAGQKLDGDGFTLYEEYRGWVVDGQRIEGDPKRKDFFVLNLIGADARKGIALFEKVSELRVHSKLRRSEMSQTTRLMNGNHRDAPQRVKQHGVWVKMFATPNELGGTGAFTRMNKAGVAGRPGLVDGIGLLPRGHEKSEFSQPHNLPRFFSLFAYDRGIAHELLHSVGVEHHGEGDGSLAAKWVSPTNKRNKVGRPYFREMLGRDDSVLTLLTEQGHDIAAQYMQSAARDRELTKQFFWDKWIAEGKAYVAAREGMDRTWATAEDYAEFLLEEFGGMSLFGPVGEPGGEHSGVQDCLMRYYFAKFYRANGQNSTYYMVTEGTEPFGLELCRSREGTGINAGSHTPQSRYGSAGKNGGECFGQICPNDAIPPKKL